MSSTVWVNKADLSETSVHEEVLAPLGKGEARMKIDSFAITANNITYAVIADLFGYWNFFPASVDSGVVPVWGHAVVEASRNPEIKVGERIYGFLPMGTHLDVLPGKVGCHTFTDLSAHRQPMSPIYNQYSRLAADPEHDPLFEAERMLFGPLFKTGFLIEAMFRRENWFGAKNLIMTSASSKTAMGLASVTKDLSPAIKRIGLTSKRNVDFVIGTGLYDEVMTYEDVANLPKTATVSVDFAGNSNLLHAIHHALGDQLKYSCLVGATHVEARGFGGTDNISGPKPILFFAPDHAAAAIKDLGPKGFGEAVAICWKNFVGSLKGVVNVEERKGIAAAIPAFADTFQGKADPAIGIIIRP